jgi:predicted SAM-dependent methyltransferase
MSTVRRLLPPALRSRLRTMVNNVTAPGAPAMAACDPSGTTLEGIAHTREVVAATFLRGSGLEIGALHLPLKAPPVATVKYVDRMATADLRTHYPELAELPLVEVDVVDNGETLSTVPDASQDFVIANHFLEHCQNPFLTLQNHFRVLRVGGVLFMAVPDKRWTFDHARPCTTVEHLLHDYRNGPEWSKRSHFEEWSRLVNNRTDDAVVEQEMAHLIGIDYSIHFHVWASVELLEFIAALRQFLTFEMEMFLRNGPETLFILRRLS